jgi:hypothetical protein
MRFKIPMLCLVMILVASGAYGIGVSPAKSDVFFTPGDEKEMSFRLINNELKDMKVSLAVKGDLAEYIVIKNPVVSLGQDEPERSITYFVRLPEKMSPGAHYAEISAVESGDSEKDGNIVVANIGVIHRVNVRVPYPDRYLEGILFISDSAPGERTAFTVMLSNVGTTEITRAKGQIVITSPDGEGVASLQTNSVNVPSGEKTKITAEWVPNVDPGTYHVQVIVEYDAGKLLLLEKDMDIGEPLVEIESLKVSTFRLGTIAKFDITVANRWNKQMPDVYGVTQVSDMTGTIIDTYKTGSVNVPSLSTHVLSSYWDTTDMEPKSYLISVKVFYLGRVREKIYELVVKENQIIIKSPEMTGQVSLERPDDGLKIDSKMFMVVFGTVSVIAIGMLLYNMVISRIRKGPSSARATSARVEPDAVHEEHPELKLYIKGKLKQGYTRAALRQTLLGKGWKREIIDEEMLKAEDEMELGQ